MKQKKSFTEVITNAARFSYCAVPLESNEPVLSKRKRKTVKNYSAVGVECAYQSDDEKLGS